MVLLQEAPKVHNEYEGGSKSFELYVPKINLGTKISQYSVFLNLVPLHLDALLVACFQHSNAILIEGLVLALQIVVYGLLHVIVITKMSSLELRLHLGGRDRSRWGPGLGNTEGGVALQSHMLSMPPWQHELCGQGHCREAAVALSATCRDVSPSLHHVACAAG